MVFNTLYFLFFTFLLIKKCMSLNIKTNKNKSMVVNFISGCNYNNLFTEENTRAHDTSYKFENLKIKTKKKNIGNRKTLNSIKNTESNSSKNGNPFEQFNSENIVKQPIINNVDIDEKYDKNNYINKLYENEFYNSTNYNVYIENNKLGKYISDVSISQNEICTLYEDMNLGRLFENLVAKLYYNKKISG